MDELELYNGAWTGAEIDKRIVLVGCGTITGTGSSVTTTVTNANITAKHTVIHHNFGTPNAVANDWTVICYDGYLTVTGVVAGSTTLTLILGIAL